MANFQLKMFEYFVQVLDLRTLKWSAVKPDPDSNLDKPLDVLPASSGHSLV